MATKPSPLEQLTELLDEQEPRSNIYRELLPTLRAQASATSVVIGGLAQTSPANPLPKREDVEIVLASPSKAWTEDVVLRLGEALVSMDATILDEPPPNTVAPG